ncbi:MAG: GNAT family N-acetyltransferase [Ktedonobacteraceae bacterium]
MITIRHEQVTDYATIGELHGRAFGNRAAEATIVALLRQRRAFDPELSLVAEIDGRVIGHALFSPYQIRLLGQTIPAVNLSPIAVEPKYQGQGIGSQLILEGHRLAATRGYLVCFLLGHTSYYPRFGYKTHAFGSAQVLVRSDEILGSALDTRGPTNEDPSMLYRLWFHEESAVDMSIEPGLDLLDWISPNPEIRATVYTRDEAIVSYTRMHIQEPTSPRVFLASDYKAARAIVATMAQTPKSALHETGYILPLHPFSASAKAFGHANCIAQNACMACSLGPSQFNDYLARVESGQRPPGRVTWPTCFDLG